MATKHAIELAKQHGQSEMQIATAQELADDIRKKIEEGRLKPGDRLEPIRSLAETVGLNRNTVAAAYKKLQHLGLVEPSGRNMRVSLRPIINDEEYLRRTYPGVVDLSFNNPDPALLPDATKVLHEMSIESPSLYGDPADNQQLCKHFLNLNKTLEYPDGEMIISSGNTDVMERLLRLYLSFGDKVAIEDPCYMKLLHLVRANGLTPLPLSMDSEGIIPQSLKDMLEAGAKAVFVTPRAQNPTGVCITVDRARELREVLDQFPDVLVVEDEHAGPLIRSKANSLIDPKRNHWAILHSAAKYLGPDLRVGGTIASPRTIGRLRSQRALGGQAISHIMQTLTCKLFELAELKSLFISTATTYARRRIAFEKALTDHNVPYWPGTGLNVWIPAPRAERLAGRLFREGWEVRTGSEFCLQSENGLRVTISQLEETTCHSLAKAISDHY